MSKKMQFVWWVYVISGITLIFFLSPALISAADTMLVLLGVALLVLYGVWTWKLWFTRFLNFVKESWNEL